MSTKKYVVSKSPVGYTVEMYNINLIDSEETIGEINLKCFSHDYFVPDYFVHQRNGETVEGSLNYFKTKEEAVKQATGVILGYFEGNMYSN